MQVDTQNINQQREISLKDFILKIKDLKSYVLRKWLTVIICGLLGAGLGLTFSLLSKDQYIGSLTFVLEENKSSPLGAYAGLASQFGIDLGGSGSSGVFEGDNILEFLRSRLMVEKTLMHPVVIDGQKISLADLYIRFNEIDKKWNEIPQLKGLHFPPNLPRSKFSLKQDSVLNAIQKKIVDKNLEIEKPDKKLSFISVKCTSLNEIFSKIFVERLVKEATDFYVETKTKRSKVNVDKLQSAADSLEILLNRKTFSLAAAQDLNMNPARQMASAGSEVQARDKIVLQTMYAEVVKNLELSKMAMAQETPVIQEVDTPILPLEKKRFGKLKGLIIGGFFGGMLTVLFLLMKKGYRDIMND